MNLKKSAALIGTLVLPLAVMAQNVATVNGKPVPKARVDALIKNATHGEPGDAPPEMRAQATDSVVMLEVLSQQAERDGIPQTPEYKAELDAARQQIMVSLMFQQYVKKNPVSDAQAQAWYDHYKAEHQANEVHAHHILVDSEDQAKKLIAQIKAGAKFEDIAKKESKDTQSAAQGGDLPFTNPSTYVPEFSAALEKLKPGEMTDTPVRSQFGYHIIRLDETRPVKFPAFEDVKDKVKQQMQQEEVQAYREKLRKSAKTDYKWAVDAAAAQQGAAAASAAK